MLAATGKGQYDLADSVVRAVATTSKSPRQAARSALYLANISELQGKLSEARRWAARQSEVLLKANPTDAQRLAAAFDTAYYESGADGNRARSIAAVERGFARTPVSEIPPADRPWGFLFDLAVSLRDPAMMRQATAGLERDMLPTVDDTTGFRARLAAGVAYAEGRWADAIRELNAAEERFNVEKKLAMVMRGMAWRELGQRDSAIAEFERFVTTQDPMLFYDSHWKVYVLQSLGEMYEEKGEPKLAVDRYSQITQLWANADPSLQPRVKAVRERIAKLMGKVG
jgi:tetratricopeptide (TPR) repeat protein